MIFKLMQISALYCDVETFDVCITQHILTDWGQDKMDAISQTTFTNAFSEWKYLNFD